VAAQGKEYMKLMFNDMIIYWVRYNVIGSGLIYTDIGVLWLPWV
jgi:hypothetical protein